VNNQPNDPVRLQAITPNNAAIVTRYLQEVVTMGTGVRAQLADGRPVAGKTGTTENYGDAWFVGYTPQLAVSVWVGYPNKLRPMTTQFQGGPVAGGTFPALIFKTFMEQALPYLNAQPQSFASPLFPAPVTESVVFRDGVWQRDNGQCKGTVSLVFFSDRTPARLANCRANEVEVPNVLGENLDDATTTLSSLPLRTQPIYKPALPGQSVGVVVGQIPAIGAHLEPLDTVRVVLAKPLHGTVPNVVGLSTAKALEQLAGRGLKPVVSGTLLAGSPGGQVLSQDPRAGVAAAPAMAVKLVVAG
jgi:hypothetical protein